MQISQYNSYNTPSFGANISELTAQKLKKLVERKLNDKQIGEMYGVSKTTIRKIRTMHQISPGRKRPDYIDYNSYDFYYLRTLIDEGNSISQIAKFYKKSAAHIRRVLEHFKLKTQEAILAAAVKKEDLSKLISEGKTQEEIARAFFLEDHNTVTHLIKKYGLEMPVHKIDKILSIDKITSLIFRGMKPKEIAKKYGVDSNTIIMKMKDTGFYDVYQELYQPHDIPKNEILTLIKDGYSISQIAEINHVSLMQMIKYMLKNEILNTKIPLKKLIKSVQEGMTIQEIALEHEVYTKRVSKLLAENNLQTKGQQVRPPVPKEVVAEKIKGCKTYTQLGQKLDVSPGRAKILADRFGLDIEREILPEIADITKIMDANPKISIDELAQILKVEPTSVERVMNKNKIKIYRSHKISDYKSFDFVKWVSWLMKHGDSPVQLGELMGMSSTKARKIVEKLGDEYQDIQYLKFPKIPKDKLSPTSQMLIQAIEHASKQYKYPQNNPYNYSQIHLAENFLEVKLCEKFKISNSTLSHLLDKYDLNEIYDNCAKQMANR